MNEQQVLNSLTAKRIPAVITGYADDMVDGEVTILGSQLSVQVGFGSFVLVEHCYENDQLTGVRYYDDTTDNFELLVKKVNELR